MARGSGQQLKGRVRRMRGVWPSIGHSPIASPELVGRRHGRLGRLRPLDGMLGASVETEKWARQAVLDGWAKIFPGIEPLLQEIQAIQAIGALEGQYGLGWKDKASPVTGLQTSMEGSNNWGGVQCKCKADEGVCCDGCGYWYDSMPTADGQQYFEQCFRRYATPADGAAGILEILTHMQGVLDALPTGDLDEIAWQMRKAHYFMGFTPIPEQAAADYASILDKKVRAIAEALGEERAARRRGGKTASIPCKGSGGECDPADRGTTVPGGSGGGSDGSGGSDRLFGGGEGEGLTLWDGAKVFFGGLLVGLGGVKAGQAIGGAIQRRRGRG